MTLHEAIEEIKSVWAARDSEFCYSQQDHADSDKELDAVIFAIVHDNDELLAAAEAALVWVCGPDDEHGRLDRAVTAARAARAAAEAKVSS